MKPLRQYQNPLLSTIGIIATPWEEASTLVRGTFGTDPNNNSNKIGTKSSVCQHKQHSTVLNCVPPITVPVVSRMSSGFAGFVLCVSLYKTLSGIYIYARWAFWNYCCTDSKLHLSFFGLLSQWIGLGTFMCTDYLLLKCNRPRRLCELW